MNKRENQDPLREWLRAGDPAGDGCAPTSVEVAAMRRRVLDAQPTGPAIGWRVSPAWALVAAVLLAVVLGRGFAPGTAEPAGVAEPSITPTQTADETPRQRQIQFDTPGGTRVVWVLDADFEV